MRPFSSAPDEQSYFGEEEKNLQELFWNHFKASNLHGVIRARIGAKFLRDNKSLV